MLVHRTPPWVLFKPGRNAAVMKTTQALETGHRVANAILFKTNGAFGIIDAVFLRCHVWEHAGSSRSSGRRCSVGTWFSGHRPSGAVSRNTIGNMGFSSLLKVRQLPGWELPVAYGTFVFFGNLGRWWQWPVDGHVMPTMVKSTVRFLGRTVRGPRGRGCRHVYSRPSRVTARRRFPIMGAVVKS
jgi:hypothetical protein